MKISEAVRVYLKNKPYTLEALEKGIVNFSALARIIQKDTGIGNYHAIKAALRRYVEEIRGKGLGIEKHAQSILKGSTITIQSGVSVVITYKDIDLERSSKIKLNDYFVYLTYDKPELEKIRKYSSIKVHEDASAIIIHSEDRLESSPGFVAFVASLLAEQDINIIEFISCYTETLLVVSRSDALKGHGLLMGITDK
ncbi:MAG: DUF7523 family protein [Candidatus Micrarchaeaceae archaeon]